MKTFKVIQNELNENHSDNVDFNRLTENLNSIFDDRRYKVKVMAQTANCNSFIAEYRHELFYSEKDKYGWTVYNLRK